MDLHISKACVAKGPGKPQADDSQRLPLNLSIPGELSRKSWSPNLQWVGLTLVPGVWDLASSPGVRGMWLFEQAGPLGMCRWPTCQGG